MNRIYFFYCIIMMLTLFLGCNIRGINKFSYDANYVTYKDTTQSYIVSEIVFNEPILLKNNNYGPWVIVEKDKVMDIVKDERYLNRVDVFLYGDNFSFYSDLKNVFSTSAEKRGSNLFSVNSMEKEPQLIKIDENSNGFKSFKFICDSNTVNGDIKLLLGFISINRFNKLNNYENSFQFISNNFNVEYRKIVYPFCVYKKEN